MNKLSAVIITLNEEKNIARCLDSLKGIVEEIIVVDSLSTDKTKEICESYGVTFIEHAFNGYQDQKNYAMAQASFDYVLNLDADEVLSPELQKSILEAKRDFKFNGYRFNRLTNYNGHWVRYCGWYPDCKMRLVKKSLAQWTGGQIHEYLKVEGPEKVLSGDLLHYSYESIAAHIAQANKFSTMEAIEHVKRGKKVSLYRLVTRPVFQFFKDYIIKKGYKDGLTGFIICTINGMYVLLKYAKMMDIKKDRNI